MALKLKPSVYVAGLQPEALLAIMVARDVFGAHGYDCILTSGLDGKHGGGAKPSLHYSGQAVDFRVRHMPPELAPVVRAEMKEALGPDYDIVVEAAGTPNQHLHCEFDPKGDRRGDL